MGPVIPSQQVIGCLKRRHPETVDSQISLRFFGDFRPPPVFQGARVEGGQKGGVVSWGSKGSAILAQDLGPRVVPSWDWGGYP